MATSVADPAPGELAGTLDLGSLRLTYQSPIRTVLSMRTHLKIDAALMGRLEQEAARRGCSVSDLVENALRSLLDASDMSSPSLSPLPTFNSGGALVDISDRDALYRAMEGF